MMGEKLIFLEILMCFMVEMADVGLYYVVAGEHLYDVGSLARVGLVTAQGCRGY
jgi:hypothetical protein